MITSKKDERTGNLVVILTKEEISRRLDNAVFDLIAVRLADKYVLENGDAILHELIDIKALKEYLETTIKQRLQDEAEKKVLES